MTDEKDLPNHCICIACGLKHKNVEAGGVWYCPNPLCPVSEASWFKMKLDSYQEKNGSKYTVDIEELVEKGLKYLETIDDETIKQAALNHLRTSKLYQKYRDQNKGNVLWSK